LGRGTEFWPPGFFVSPFYQDKFWGTLSLKGVVWGKKPPIYGMGGGTQHFLYGGTNRVGRKPHIWNFSGIELGFPTRGVFQQDETFGTL